MEENLAKVTGDSAKGGFFLLSGTAIATIIMAIASIVVARILAPEDYGQYSLALLIPQLLLLFTELGISQGITKFSAELRAKGEESRISKIVNTGLLLRVTAGIIIFLINYTFAEFFASFLLQRPELAFYIRIASTSILFQVAFTTATSAFVGLDKTEYCALSSNIQALAKAIISIILVLIGFGITGAIIGHVVSYIIASAIGIVILLLILRKTQRVQKSSSFTENAKVLFKYGAPLYISLLLTGFVPLFKNILLAFFVTDIEIGNYKAAINFASLLTVLATPITTALLPAFSKLNTNAKAIRAFFKVANKYTTLIMVPATFLVIIFSNQIVQLVYGSTYAFASSYLATYVLLYLLVGIGYLSFSSLYNGLGETKATLKISAINFIVLLNLSPFLTNAYGVQGLIVAFLVANFAGQIYAAYYGKRKFQITFEKRAILKIYAISAISSIIPLLISNLLRIHLFLLITIGSVLYLSSYVTLMPLTRIITSTELYQATQIVQNMPLIAPVARQLLKYQQKILTRTSHIIR